MTDRRLIVSADDFGLAPAVDRGIVAAVAARTVTSVGVMATCAAPDAVERLAAGAPGLSIGVHLDLTTGPPVSGARAVPSLVGAAGTFRPLGALTRAAFAGRLARAELIAELAAQVARVRAAGVGVDHLDSHEHVHLLPGVFAAFCAVADATGVRRVRSHRPRLVAAGGAPWSRLRWYARRPRRVATHAAKHVLAARLAARGFAAPDGMVSGSLLAGAPAGSPLAEWDALSAALPRGTFELVVHPADLGGGIDDAERARLGALVDRRAAELAALLDPRLPAFLRARGVTLVSFAALAAPRGAPLAPPLPHARRA